MFKVILIATTFVFMSSFVLAADVSLRWDPSSGATGYKIQKSVDLGVTWSAPVDVGNVLIYIFTGVEENILVIFRSIAYNASGESTRSWSGAWFDQRKKPVSPPSAQGIQ